MRVAPEQPLRAVPPAHAPPPPAVPPRLCVLLAFRPLPGVAPIFKGERQGVAQAYTVTSSFSVPTHDLAGGRQAGQGSAG